VIEKLALDLAMAKRQLPGRSSYSSTFFKLPSGNV